MKVIGTLVAVPHEGDHKFVVISPKDDIWFLHDEDATAEMQKEAMELCKGKPAGVVGYILQGEKSK